MAVRSFVRVALIRWRSQLVFGLLSAVSLLPACEYAPATYGSHQRLSTAPDRVLVVVNQPSAVNTALTWLQARGLSAVGPPMPMDGAGA